MASQMKNYSFLLDQCGENIRFSKYLLPCKVYFNKPQVILPDEKKKAHNLSPFFKGFLLKYTYFHRNRWKQSSSELPISI